MTRMIVRCLVLILLPLFVVSCAPPPPPRPLTPSVAEVMKAYNITFTGGAPTFPSDATWGLSRPSRTTTHCYSVGRSLTCQTW